MSYSRKRIQTNVLQKTPIPKENEKIVKVTELRGANICEIEYPDGKKVLAQIPQKFRKLIWIKKGNYVIIREPEVLVQHQDKIKCFIEHILLPEHVKILKMENKWPYEFMENNNQIIYNKDHDKEIDTLFFNPNHQLITDDDDNDDDNGDENEDNENEYNSEGDEIENNNEK